MLGDLNASAELIMVGESTRGEPGMPFSRGIADFRRGRALFAEHCRDAGIAAQHQRDAALQNGAPLDEREVQSDEAIAQAAPAAWTNCLFRWPCQSVAPDGNAALLVQRRAEQAHRQQLRAAPWRCRGFLRQHILWR
jgi:hypothetical protein